MANLTQAQRLEMASQYLLSQLKFHAPKDTGNLYLNAIRLVQITPDYWKIVIGGELAPYAIYTPKTSRRKDWVNIAIQSSMSYIQQIMSGRVTEDDLFDILDRQEQLNNDDWREQREEKNKM